MALKFVRDAPLVFVPDPHYGGVVPVVPLPPVLYATVEDPTVEGEHSWWVEGSWWPEGVLLARLSGSALATDSMQEERTLVGYR